MLVYDVLIIGSGLGGLICGNILSKEGYRVCIIEKNKQIGGCLQVFTRDKCIFNTGLNYTEGLEEGQILYKYFKYLGLMDKLKLKQLDKDGFEVITFKGKEYRYAQGHENFVETLGKSFPDEIESLKKYIASIEEISNLFPLFNLDKDQPNIIDNDIFNISVNGYLSSVTSNRKLQNVLAATNSLYAGVPDKTPLYIHALINYSFISSAWRLVDGSSQLAKHLSDSIKKNGGDVMMNCEAKKLVFEKKIPKFVKLTNSERIESKFFISNVHPVKTLQMIDRQFVKKVYRKRINSLENTMGMFTLYISLKKNSFEYMNFNHYYFAGDTVWTSASYTSENWPQYFMLYTPATSKSDKYADGIIVITYMKYEELKRWENTFIEHRGQDYLEFKKEKAERLLDIVEQKFPGVRSKIKSYYTSTPLTYRDYTGTVDGSAYGILKDYRDPFKAILLPKTKIPNLYLTGQNLNMHGILGVTIGAVMTSAELLGMDYLMKKIKL